jgi:plasmid stability protein
MADVILKDVPDDELTAFETHAARHGRSAEEELRHLLHEAAAEEVLTARLEQATRAIDARMKKVEAATATSAPPRKRYRAVEPTPRRRKK